MPWHSKPPVAGTEIQADLWLRDFDWAFEERYKVISKDGPTPYPPEMQVWTSGKIVSIAYNGDGNIDVVCDNNNSWINGSSTCTPEQYVDFSCTDCQSTILPRNYDFVTMSDPRDLFTNLRGRIVAQDADTKTFTIQSAEFTDAMTAKFITGLSQFVGKPYKVVAAFGLTSADRFPPKPNDNTLWIDIGDTAPGYWPDDDTVDPVTGEVTHNGPQYTTILSSKITNSEDPPWGKDQWVGKDLLIGGGGNLKRLVIAHNTDDKLFFTLDATIPGGPFIIGNTGFKGKPARPTFKPFQWYTGAATFAAGHKPDDTLATVNVPEHSIRVGNGNPCFIGTECKDENRTVFDYDYQYPQWAEDGALCSGNVGEFYSKDIYHSIRMKQHVLMRGGAQLSAGLVSHFLPMSWNGSTFPQKYTPAMAFKDANINWGTSTTQYDSVGYPDNDPPIGPFFYFTVDSKYIGKRVWYTVFVRNGSKKGNKAEKTSGYATVQPDGRVIQVGGLGYTDETTNDAGLSVVYSAGWTRYRPRWLKYFYPKWGFMPDIRAAEFGGGVWDPPEVATDEETGKYDCSGKGTWIRRPKSTLGVVVSDGQLYEAETLVTDALYRIVGDNYRDAFPGGTMDDEQIAYSDKFYRGKLSKENQAARDNSRVGDATAGGKYYLTDATKNWWSDWANNGSTLRAESGTVTAKTSTSITDSGKDTLDPYKPDSCWFDTNERFPGAPYVDFILEITHTNIDSTTTVTKMPITNVTFTSGHPVISFTAIPGYSPAVGDTWQIKEPAYELNKWEGRTVIITYGDGSTVNATITHSDKDTLFFAPLDVAVDDDCSYVITERGFGGVWRWNGTEFVKPTGMDTTRIGVTSPADFKDDQTMNLEGFVKDYGVVEMGDAITVKTFKEIYDVVNLLQWTTVGGIGWTSRADPDVEELNVRSYGGYLSFNEFYNPDGEEPTYGPRLTWPQGMQYGINYFKAEAMSDPEDNDYESPTKPPDFSVGITASRGFYSGPADTEWDYGESYMGAGTSYAYGVIPPLPNQSLPRTVDYWLYTAINAADTVEIGEKLIFINNEQAQSTRGTFDGGSTGYTFRTWSLYGNYDPDPEETITGYKVGEITNILDELPSGDEVEPPPDYHADPRHWAYYVYDTVYETRGWAIADEIGVVKWTMEFVP